MLKLWLRIIYGCLVAVFAQETMAKQFCFAMAESYYEQVYCELEVKAQTKSLPSFEQFRKNDERVQASLLKRLAERNNIKLPLPKFISNAGSPEAATASVLPFQASVPPSQTSVSPSQTKVSSGQTTELSAKISVSNELNECVIAAKAINCATSHFHLAGNKANSRLAANALSAENLMGLPVFDGQLAQAYLPVAYRQYIEKMDAIGLAGVTMTYGKFSYLFRDVQAKGLNFSDRFETMYRFLKKDKATMGVSEASSMPRGLSLSDCQQLTFTRIVCAHQGRNYLFEI
jgi:hypothetical protein